MNKKEKRAAIRSALSDKLANEKLIVVDEIKMEEKKTKKFAELLANINAVKPLVVLPENDENVVYSARNIEDAMTALPETINVYDIMKAGTLVLTKDSVKKIEEVYS